jgi:glucose-6-phosphate 1-dehydrogenase
VLAFVAMEPPDSLAPEHVRDCKAELLQALRPALEGRSFFLSTGKRLPQRATEVANRPPRAGRRSRRSSRCSPGVDNPGRDSFLVTVSGHLVPLDHSGRVPAADELVLGERQRKPTNVSCTTRWDQTLFLRGDAVERSWEIVAPILDAPGTVHPYAAGTWGPSAADELIAPRTWRPS